MTIGVLIDIAGCTAEQYDRVVVSVGLAPPHAVPPPGMISHAGGPTPGGWRVFDVWESREHYERFVHDHLKAALRAAQVPPFAPEVIDLHNYVHRHRDAP